MIPSSGTLSPGEQVDVQIKFCPTEGVKLCGLRNLPTGGQNNEAHVWFAGDLQQEAHGERG